MQAAFGSYGAFLAGPKALTDFLRVTASTFLSSGTLPPEIIESALAAVRISRSPEGLSLRQRLLENARMVRARLQALGFVVPPGEGPIIPIAIGKDLKTLMAGKKLFDLGVLVAVLVHPEVPKGRGMFRISLTASHSHEDIEALVEAFRELRHYLPKHENPLRQAAHVATELYRARWRRPGFLGAQTVKKINL